MAKKTKKAKTKPAKAKAAEQPIPLQDPDRWEVRIAANTTKVDVARLEELVEMGWLYVDPDDLATNSKDIGFKVMDSRVVRGDKGEEVLIKILKVDLAAFEEADKAKKVAVVEEVDLAPAKRSLEKSQVAKAAPPTKAATKASTKAAKHAAAHAKGQAARAAHAQWYDSGKMAKTDTKVKAKAPKAAKAKKASAKK